MKRNKYIQTLSLSLLTSVSLATFADVDVDNDGLIEIHNLTELDLMRYDLAGTSLNGDSTGCPNTGCFGYELVNDIDFDTNGNGEFDEGDQFWNDGYGWLPIGTNNYVDFSAEFNGNNVKLLNLNNNLFDSMRGATIYNLYFVDPHMINYGPGILARDIFESKVSDLVITGGVVKGLHYSGGLADSASDSSFERLSLSLELNNVDKFYSILYFGGVVGYSYDNSFDQVSFSGNVAPRRATSVGGLVGMSDSSIVIRNSVVSNAYLQAYGSVGGLVGDSRGSVQIENSLFVGELTAGYNISPLLGDYFVSGDTNTITSSYWDSEVSGIVSSQYGEGHTTAELQCPTMPSDTNCDSSVYASWDESIWDFGISSEYPSLIRDFDKDGFEDHIDIDDNNNGLIEIHNLTELDLMRYDLAGTSLNGDSTGCPNTGCFGYELVNDIDFDTNGNGEFDEGDQFWNDGYGWLPIGTNNYVDFSAEFNGNNVKLLNLNNNLFDSMRGATIYNLYFVDPHMINYGPGILARDIFESKVSDLVITGGVVKGLHYSGGLADSASDSSFERLSLSLELNNVDKFYSILYFGGVVGYSYDNSFDQVSFSGNVAPRRATSVGGLVGMSDSSIVIRNSVVSNAYLQAYGSVGGLVGDSRGSVQIENSLFVGELTAGYNISPLLGDYFVSGDTNTITSSYWDSEVSGIVSSQYGEGYTTAELQCPTMPSDTNCDSSVYANWDESIWDFGTSSEYPSIR